jgi:hypothetical protein
MPPMIVPPTSKLPLVKVLLLTTMPPALITP